MRGLAWLLLAAMQCFHIQNTGGAEAAEKSSAAAWSARQLVSPPTGAWVTNGGNTYNWRYSPLRQIDRDNVAKLKAEWRVSLRGSGMGARSGNQAQRYGQTSEPKMSKIFHREKPPVAYLRLSCAG